MFVSPDVVLWAISGSSEVFQHVHFMIRILQVSRGVWGWEAPSPVSEMCMLGAVAA